MFALPVLTLEKIYGKLCNSLCQMSMHIFVFFLYIGLALHVACFGINLYDCLFVPAGMIVQFTLTCRMIDCGSSNEHSNI